MEKFVLILFPALISATGAKLSVYAQVGEKVVLKPPAIHGSYQYVYWTFKKEDGLQLAWRNHLGGSSVNKDEPWTDKLTLSGDSLVIANVQPENFGTFFCKINSGTPILPIHSIELIKLDVSVNPANPLLPGDPLSLSCTTDYNKKPEIYWQNPGGKRMDGQGTVAVTVTSQDDGMWTCVVAEDKQVQMLVKVLDLSPAPLLPHYTSTSSPITLPCSIPPLITWEQIKAKGVQEVHWQFFPETSSGHNSDVAQRLFSLSLNEKLSWKEDQPRDLSPARKPETGNLTLTRKLGRVDDRGAYVCTMKFKNGRSLNRTVQVEVLQIASSPGTHLRSGQQLNLTCSVGKPLPSDLQLRWSRPEQSDQPGWRSDTLTIPEVSTDDGGRWVCGLLQGETLLTSAVITLTIEPKVSVWMLVIACSAAAIVILLLLILALILRRRRRRKTRHLRHQLCRCKVPKPKGFYRT